MFWNAYNRVKVEFLNWIYEPPRRGIPPYRICDYCGRPAKFGERWRESPSRPNAGPTKTRCKRCSNECVNCGYERDKHVTLPSSDEKFCPGECGTKIYAGSRKENILHAVRGRLP